MDNNNQEQVGVSSMVQMQSGLNTQNSTKRSKCFKKPRNRRLKFFHHPAGRFLPQDCFVK
jgi:hypothetical protein